MANGSNRSNTFPSDDEGIVSLWLENQRLLEENQKLAQKIDEIEGKLAEFQMKYNEHQGYTDKNTENIEILFSRINAMKNKPSAREKERRETLIKMLVLNGGKMLESEARKKMNLRKDLFSQLLASMKEDILVKPYHADRRKNIIILRD